MDSKTNKEKIYKIIMLIIIVSLVTFILTTVLMYNKFATTLGKKYNVTDTNVKMMAKINTVKRILERDYLGNMEEQKLIEGAVKGYVNGIGDEYTEYFTKDEMDDFKQETEGNYVGIGIYMTKNTRDNTIVIIAPIKGSPAESAGIKTGDIIKKVDGVEYTGDDYEKISSYIKGKNGTKVNLEVEREGETLNFEIERRKIELYPIESEVLENNIGYISLSSFDENCSKKFKDNYDKLVEKNIKSLIIDVRNNGGGIVGEALKIADYALDKDKKIITTVDKKGKETEEKSKKEKIINIPIIVLVNENTASASEILAVALKENEVAKVVGTRTYGKGVIQELLTLPDGSGLKITIEEYYTPNHNKLNKEGVTPDEEVKLPEKIKNIYNIEKKDDTQLQKAIEMLK